MRGEILKVATPTEMGTILGADGQRYTYSADQVRADTGLRPGQTIDFVDLGQEARDIYIIASANLGGVAAAAPAAPVMTPSYATASATPADGLWSYFIRGVTTNYVNFQGRARRSEYWGYTLFWWIFLILALVLDTFISLAVFGGDLEEGFLPILTILFALGTILPNIALWVRRFHDLDMSGWMYLLGMIPYVGGLILFVFSLLDSKPGTNAYGVSPKYGGNIQADVFV